MSWVNNWFGTAYYQMLYRHRDEREARQFLDRLMSFLPVKPGMRVLDIGCGQGRHSLYLAQKGFDVTGLDVVEENIKAASRYKNKHLDFIRHDMRDPFPVHDADLALNLFTSFGYFENEEDDIKALENINQALKESGQLVLDFFNAYKVEKELCPSDTIFREQVRFDIKRYIEDGKVVKEIHVADHGKNCEFREKVQLLSLEDFEKYLPAAGFEITNIFGNYNLMPFEKERSDRLIIIGEKNTK